jgi:hypothetical protein
LHLLRPTNHLKFDPIEDYKRRGIFVVKNSSVPFVPENVAERVRATLTEHVGALIKA